MSLKNFRHTKVIVTLGPSVLDYDAILSTISAGVDGICLNFDDRSPEENKRLITHIRKASKVSGGPVAVIQELERSKICLGDFEGFVTVQAGQNLSFKQNADFTSSGHLPMRYDISKRVKRGERLHLSDGKIHLQITSVREDVVYARAENDGVLFRYTNISLPDTDFEGFTITTKDRRNLAFGSTQDVDYVLQRFVQTEDDVHGMRKLMKNHNMSAKLLVSVDTLSAIDHLEEITQEADAVLLDPDELAIEVPYEKVPLVQGQLMSFARRYARLAIIATDLLSSVSGSSDPTRAEIASVTNSIADGADAIMLSHKVAHRHVNKAIKIVNKVLSYNTYHIPAAQECAEHPTEYSRQAALSAAILNLSEGVGAAAIVTDDNTDGTALQVSSCRPKVPVIAVTADTRVAQQLAIAFGIESHVRPLNALAPTAITKWIRDNKMIKKGELIIIASNHYPGVVGPTDTIEVRMLE